MAFRCLKLHVNVRVKTYKEKGQNVKERTGEEEKCGDEYEVKVKMNKRMRRLRWRRMRRGQRRGG